MASRTDDRELQAMPSSWMNPALWLAEHARVRGDKPALVFRDRPLSYRTLRDRVLNLAAGLHREGVRAGERVACVSSNHPAILETYFASALLGALFVPLNFRLAPPELAFQIRDCAPAVVMVGPRQQEVGNLLASSLPGEGPRWFLIEEENPRPPCAPYTALLEEGDSRFSTEPERACSPEDPQLIMYTSGTTGLPKGAVLPFRKTLYNSLNAQFFFELSEQDTVLVPTPMYHSLGLNILSIPVLFQGGTVIMLESFDPLATLAALERHRATFMGAVPTIYQRLLQAGLDTADLRSVRFFFTAGAPIAASVIEAYHRRGILLKQGFGQTETSILCCLDSRDALRKAGSVGKPVVYGEVKVVGERLEEVPPGVIGEIVAAGPIVMLGYWKRPEEAAKVFESPWLHTQDLAWRDEEGFFTLAGRKGDMYISGGENVYPEEVEKVYLTCPEIAQIAVIGVPDSDLGEVGAAFVVPQQGARLNEESLRLLARDRLARYKIPRRFFLVDTLPTTETGKIRKYLLRERAT